MLFLSLFFPKHIAIRVGMPGRMSFYSLAGCQRKMPFRRDYALSLFGHDPFGGILQKQIYLTRRGLCPLSVRA